MVPDVDLYSILLSFAIRNNSPYIKITTILEYLDKSAKRYSKEFPLWKKWAQNTVGQFWTEISVLIEEGKCEVLPDPKSDQIYLSSFFAEKLSDAYKHIMEHVDMPFPSEESLKLKLPETQLKRIHSDYDFYMILEEPNFTDPRFYQICFPDDFGTAVIQIRMIPRQLAEIALLKMQNYLNRYGNKEFVYQKLTTLLQGKEVYVKEQIEQLSTHPLPLYPALEESGDLTSAFWAQFCSLVKSDIKRKNDRLSMDIAAYQSVHILEVINGYYKSMFVKRQEKEMAFKNLESCLSRQPYFYSMDEIIKFVGPNGTPLLSHYSREELEEWIRRKITESKNNELPALLIMKGYVKGDHCYMLKDRMLAYCTRLLAGSGLLVKSKVSKHWSKLILDFKKEPAMTDEEEFEKLLKKTAEKSCPELMVLLEDPKFFVVYQEMERKENGIPSSAKVFSKGKLLPFSSLFLIRRKDLLMDVRFALPLWYSLPIISSIIGFFKRMSKKKNPSKHAIPGDDANGEQTVSAERGHTDTINAAEELEADMLPAGAIMDPYLKELEDRWSHLLDHKAREDLIYYVKFLVRDNLRRTLKLQKQFKPTRETINQMADSIILHNQTLSSISSRDSLLFYIELYLVKLLQKPR